MTTEIKTKKFIKDAERIVFMTLGRIGDFDGKCPKCRRSFTGCRNIGCQRFYNGGIWSKISGSTSFG
jgi:hypothetical protein